MKKISFVIALFLIGNFSNAQTFGLSDLVKISQCKDFDCAKKAILKKDFSFLRSGEKDQYAEEVYTSNQATIIEGNAKLKTNNTVYVRLYKDGVVSVTFTTWVNDTFLRLLKEAGNAAFKPESTETNETATMTHYNSAAQPEVRLSIAQSRVQSKDGSYMKYVFIVER
jgi:hypothetical protein